MRFNILQIGLLISVPCLFGQASEEVMKKVNNPLADMTALHCQSMKPAE